MPIAVNNIIHYRDYGKSYHRLEFNANEPVTVKYVAGDFGSLIPKGMVLNTNIKSSFNEPLFNKSNNGNISENIVHPTLLYLEIVKEKAIKELYLSHNNIVYDLFYGKEGLIYSFYLGSDNMLSIKMKVHKDINGIYQKLKANPDDLFYRQHFVKGALATSKMSFSDRNIVSYPELMTVAQVASYLNKTPKTIQNLASLKKIHRVKRGSTTFYPKSELDKSEYVVKKNK